MSLTDSRRRKCLQQSLWGVVPQEIENLIVDYDASFMSFANCLALTSLTKERFPALFFRHNPILEDRELDLLLSQLPSPPEDIGSLAATRVAPPTLLFSSSGVWHSLAQWSTLVGEDGLTPVTDFVNLYAHLYSSLEPLDPTGRAELFTKFTLMCLQHPRIHHRFLLVFSSRIGARRRAISCFGMVGCRCIK
jgi:hypothetical protein